MKTKSEKVGKMNFIDLLVISMVTLSCIAICIVLMRGITPDIDLTVWDFLSLIVFTGILIFLSVKGIAQKSFDKFQKILDPNGVL